MKIICFLLLALNAITSYAQKISGYQSLYLVVNGKEYTNTDFAAVKEQKQAANTTTLLLKGKKVPLEVSMIIKDYNGVFTRSIILENISSEIQTISKAPSLYFRLPLHKYELQYLKTVWGNERQLESTAFTSDSNFSFVINMGRTGEGYSSWFSLSDKTTKLRYMAQLAYSANWEMHFRKSSDGREVEVQMGMLFDEGEGLKLEPGEKFVVPEAAFTVGQLSLDEAANRLHRYQREYVIPPVKTNDPLLVEYNTWFAAPDKVYVDDVKKLVDAAADLGCEAFVQDAGWYNEKDWWSNLGDFFPTKTSFPNGLEELADYVRAKKMLFGLWVEIESAGRESIVYKEHPGWFLRRDGKPVYTANRYHFNFANDSAWNWALGTISRLVNNYHLNWIKIDYNNSVGNQFDEQYRGIALYNHLQGYFRLLDTVRSRFPLLIVENCASGGLRTDLGTMKHTNTAWVSDVTSPENAPQLAWGANLEFVPEINNYWMTGDTSVKGSWFCKDAPMSPGWWDYMFKIAMNGQFGISSRIDRWSDPLKETARQNIQLYKKARSVIKGADVYHITSMPDHSRPKGNMALQFQNKKKNLLMAYRFEDGSAKENYKLKNLDAAKTYDVMQNGKKQSTVTGKDLMTRGASVKLAYDFSAALLEISEVD